MVLAAGTKLGRYEIRSKIGDGGMGEVYLAEDTQLHRRVAIKFLPGDSVADERANKRLLREAQAAAKLDHPNICAVHEIAEADGRNFIVMPYVEGETLDIRLKQKPLDISESLGIATHVADALAEAHEHGIIHRDVKPSNVIITSRGQVKVLDFGLAKLSAVAGKPDAEASTQALLTTPRAIAGTVPGAWATARCAHRYFQFRRARVWNAHHAATLRSGGSCGYYLSALRAEEVEL